MSEIINIFLCIVIPLAVLFCVVKREMRVPVLFLIFGLLIAVLAAYGNAALKMAGGFTDLETVLYVAPLVEELLKAIPLVLFIFIKKPDIRTALVAAVAVGAGFATIENITYMLSYDVNNIGFMLIRGLSAGLMHSMTLVILTVVIFKLSKYKYGSATIIVGILSFSMLFHGLYNMLVNSGYSAAAFAGYILPPLLTLVCLILLYRNSIGKFFKRIRRIEE
ncbi:MAG TPA: PrsW family glutamic-type intramembrane protease [Methanocorpusculum sp.]|nr:PrsW family glutamic-type intramembrane protease [Methanocorpusculum sp.]